MNLVMVLCSLSDQYFWKRNELLHPSSYGLDTILAVLI